MQSPALISPTALPVTLPAAPGSSASAQADGDPGAFARELQRSLAGDSSPSASPGRADAELQPPPDPASSLPADPPGTGVDVLPRRGLPRGRTLPVPADWRAASPRRVAPDVKPRGAASVDGAEPGPAMPDAAMRRGRAGSAPDQDPPGAAATTAAGAPALADPLPERVDRATIEDPAAHADPAAPAMPATPLAPEPNLAAAAVAPAATAIGVEPARADSAAAAPALDPVAAGRAPMTPAPTAPPTPERPPAATLPTGVPAREADARPTRGNEPGPASPALHRSLEAGAPATSQAMLPARGEADAPAPREARSPAPTAEASLPASSGARVPVTTEAGAPAPGVGSTTPLPTFAQELLRTSQSLHGPQPHASGPAAELRIPTPVTAPEFVPRVSADLALLARDGVQQARLDVHPVELGPISVQINVDGTTAQVHLGVDSALTRQVLESAMPALAAALRDQGLTLNGGGVFQQHQQSGQGGGRDAHAGSGHRPGAAPEPASLAVPAAATRLRHVGSLDLYA